LEERDGGSPFAGEPALESVNAGYQAGLAAEDVEDAGLDGLGRIGMDGETAFEDGLGLTPVQ